MRAPTAIAALTAWLAAAGAVEAQARELGCLLMTEDGPLALVDVEVGRRAAENERFRLEIPDGVEARGIYCRREDAVPGPHDYKIVLAGYPLVLSLPDDAGRALVTQLVVEDGRFALHVMEGALAAEERALARERLTSYHAAVGEDAP